MKLGVRRLRCLIQMPLDRAATAAQFSGDLVDLPAALSEFMRATSHVALCIIFGITEFKPIRQRLSIRWRQASVPACTVLRVLAAER